MTHCCLCPCSQYLKRNDCLWTAWTKTRMCHHHDSVGLISTMFYMSQTVTINIKQSNDFEKYGDGLQIAFSTIIMIWFYNNPWGGPEQTWNQCKNKPQKRLNRRDITFPNIKLSVKHVSRRSVVVLLHSLMH